MAGSWRGPEAGPDIILGYGNIQGIDFETRVAVAAAAGFSNIGYSILEFQSVKREMTPEDLAAIAKRHGVRVAELEIGLGFDGGYNEAGAGDPPRWGPSTFPWDVPYLDRQTEDEMFALAAAFGSNHMVMGGSWGSPMPESAERFAALCDRAAEIDVKLAIEFMPGTSVPDIATTLRVVQEADRPNGGLCVDNWHYMRGNRDEAALWMLPADRVVVLRLSDGTERPRSDVYFDETLNYRELFGDGEWDMKALLDSLWASGVTAPISIEVLSALWRSRSPEDLARSFMDATQKLVARSR
jgi:sugar phosphate isomerase/epimerase